MVFNNLVIGKDNFQQELKCGDVCEFVVKHEHNISNRYKGMIIYDDYEFAFMFEMLQDDFPLVVMNAVERKTIKKIASIEAVVENDAFHDREKWIEIYESHFSPLRYHE